ncbi:MAG: hypothetical protein QOE13_3131 [Gaiellaceae bacterium]|nr:hypothetical protein [Gaiellaceae bacterium]
MRQTRELRDTLRVIFEFAGTEPARAVAALDAGLIASGATPRMSHRDGWPYRYFTSTRPDCASWLAATTLTGVAAMLSEYGGRRLGTCTAYSCRAVYIDLSKNTSKVYCSQTCAHRQSVAAFRARKRADRQPAPVRQPVGRHLPATSPLSKAASKATAPRPAGSAATPSRSPSCSAPEA